MKKLQTAAEYIERLNDMSDKAQKTAPALQLLCMNLMNRSESVHLCYMHPSIEGIGILHRYTRNGRKESAIYSPAGHRYFVCMTNAQEERDMIAMWNEFTKNKNYDPFYDYGDNGEASAALLYFSKTNINGYLSEMVRNNLHSSSAE